MMNQNDYDKKDIESIRRVAAKYEVLSREDEFALTSEHYDLRHKVVPYVESLAAANYDNPDYLVLLYLLVQRRDWLSDHICIRNMKLVLSIAQKPTYQNRGLTLYDLIIHGYLGLKHAVDNKFDPYKGFKLSTYATRWIHQKISRAINKFGDLVKVAGHIKDQMSKIRVVVREFVRDNKCEKPSAEMISFLLKQKYNLDMSPERVAELGRMNWDHVSLNEESNSEEGSLSMLDYLAADEQYQPEVIYEQSEMKDKVMSVVNQLEHQEQLVIIYSFGLLDGSARTTKQIAPLLGITNKECKNILDKAMTNLIKVAPADFVEMLI